MYFEEGKIFCWRCIMDSVHIWVHMQNGKLDNTSGFECKSHRYVCNSPVYAYYLKNKAIEIGPIP